MLEDLLVFLGFLIAVGGLVKLGLLLRPRPFRPHPAPGQPGEPLPLRDALPKPVSRHFVEILGDAPQSVHSSVIWGRGKVHVRGTWLPMRFKAWYRPGVSFIRRTEMTWFLRPVLRGCESYIGGVGVQRVAGKEERGPQVDQEEALALWASALWMPSTLVHPSAATWEAVDDTSARLVFPFGGGSDSLLFFFDPESGRMTHVIGQRSSGRSGEKEDWRIDLLEWKTFHGQLIPCLISASWGETGSPWSYWSVDGVAYNVKVDDQLP
jgi:hypothetical protein